MSKKKSFIHMYKYMYKEVSGPQKVQKEDYSKNCKKRKAIREQACLKVSSLHLEELKGHPA